jgi:hypothetical protein
MDIGVPEFALRKGVSERRILQLIAKGDIKARRSMSPKMANAFIDKGLRHHDQPALLLSSWLRKRAEVNKLRAHPADLRRLLLDKRIVASGISDPRSGISASDFVEGYGRKNSLKQLQKDYLLVPSEDPNVLLRIINIRMPDPLPMGYVLADLADHVGPREGSQVERLLGKI